ncbi:hypothetical protein GDO78_015242 [Eleutherodactylus coqui]|uniref:Uncharacterized protein n=1 Tax=Eleutherodactylus coqui TaxID=57060 RepID=A0A8J6ELY9_ELECQ|nr:hypothetical protein GDO78_015242 [Eleutherodactylus coqui]
MILFLHNMNDKREANESNDMFVTIVVQCKRARGLMMDSNARYASAAPPSSSLPARRVTKVVQRFFLKMIPKKKTSSLFFKK